MTKFFIGADQWAGLSKLMEESGEVCQIAGKIIGADGEVNHWDGTNLKDRMMEELGDLQAAISFFMWKNFTPEEKLAIGDRRNFKLQLFTKWHNENTVAKIRTTEDKTSSGC